MAVLRPATRVACSFLALNLVSACLMTAPHKPAEVVYLGSQHYGKAAGGATTASAQAATYSNVNTTSLSAMPAQQAAPVESVAVTTGDLAPISSQPLPPPDGMRAASDTHGTVAAPPAITVSDTPPPAASREAIVETLNRPQSTASASGTLQLPQDYAPNKQYALPAPAQPAEDLAKAPASAEPKARPAVTAAAAAPVAPVTAPKEIAPLPAAQSAAPAPAPEPAKSVAVAPFVWPVQGKVVSGFGANVNGTANDGITIAVPEGTRVKAAADGTVVYAGNDLKAYGNLLIIRHADGWITSYAHTGKIMVQKGDAVKQGQVVALSGATGEAPQPQLHFGVRQGKEPVDPVSLLQQGGTAELNQLQTSAQSPG